MKWTELLESEIQDTYGATLGLLELVNDSELGWKPDSGSNWLTTGQLIQHIVGACGNSMKGFVTGDWGMSMEDMKNMKPEDMLPPAEKFPSAESVASVKSALAADKKMSIEMVRKAGEERLAGEVTRAPWDPTPLVLGHRLLHMVGHLGNHKSQLFYYLKLQGKPVNTMHMYGMSGAAAE